MYWSRWHYLVITMMMNWCWRYTDDDDDENCHDRHSSLAGRPASWLTDRMTIGPTDQFIDLLIDSVRLWNWLPLTPVCNFIIYSLLVTCLRWRFYCYLLMQLKINQIMNEKGFFLTMPPIAGAVDAVKEMSEMDGYVTGSLRFIVCY